MRRTVAVTATERKGGAQQILRVPFVATCAATILKSVHADLPEGHHWYALLSRFPAALVDANGYLLFESEHEYTSSPYLALGKQISVRKPGISAVPGYVRMPAPEAPPAVDVDVHEYEGTEGRARLLVHLSRERDRRLVMQKKKSALSLACEICGRVLVRRYLWETGRRLLRSSSPCATGGG